MDNIDAYQDSIVYERCPIVCLYLLFHLQMFDTFTLKNMQMQTHTFNYVHISCHSDFVCMSMIKIESGQTDIILPAIDMCTLVHW